MWHYNYICTLRVKEENNIHKHVLADSACHNIQLSINLLIHHNSVFCYLLPIQTIHNYRSRVIPTARYCSTRRHAARCGSVCLSVSPKKRYIQAGGSSPAVSRTADFVVSKYFQDLQPSDMRINSKQEAQLSQRNRATLCVIEYFAKSLKVIRNDTVE